MPKNPWQSIHRGTTGVLQALRVSADNRFGFFWAKNAEDQCVLLLELTIAPAVTPVIPQLRGITIVWAPEKLQLQLVLASDQDWELFLNLCNDLIDRSYKCRTEQKALDALLSRLDRWRRVLERAPDGILSSSEAQGLFGELVFLKNELMSRMANIAAVEAWRGPHGSPQDFTVGATLFEVKTVLVERADTVTISSAAQLWSGGRRLYLTVLSVSRSQSGGTSLAELVGDIRSELRETTAITTFEEKLYALGYIDISAYEAPKYIVHRVEFFNVAPGFPLIERAAVPAGVDSVRFSLQLAHCASFAILPEWNHIVEIV